MTWTHQPVPREDRDEINQTFLGSAISSRDILKVTIPGKSSRDS
jgi:hypothetical protein